MASRRIIWTETAKFELKNILEFYAFRNKSKTYSFKLYTKIQSELKLLIKHPNIGKKTDQLNVRALLIEDYFLFYEIKETNINILSIRNSKQNPDRTKH